MFGFNYLKRRQTQAADIMNQVNDEIDEVTQLPNKYAFYQYVEQVAERSKLYSCTMAVLNIELRDYKTIKNKFGPKGCDLFMQLATARIKGISEKAYLARSGDDEFSIILENIETPQESGNLAVKILSQFDISFLINDIEFKMPISIGIALYPDMCDDVEALHRNVVLAQNQARSAVGKKYKFFTKEFAKRIDLENNIEAEIKNGIANNEFRMVYQPQYDIDKHRVVGLESLIRWQSKKLGFVSPGDFIVIAENSGLIVELGDWIIQSVIKQLSLWREEEPELMGDVHVGINLSGVQFSLKNLAHQLLETLSDYRLPPDAIMAEITETAVLDNQSVLDDFIHNAIPMSLDDFGTGYSSISLLRHPAIRQIKIDLSFVQELLIRPESHKLIAGLIDLSKALGMNIIAEGAEEKTQVEKLHELGCHHIQGYYFSKPQEVPDVIAEIKKLNAKTSY